MTRSDRRRALSATALAIAAMLWALAATSAPAAAGATPFCVSRGGSQGEEDSSPQICAYSDYQACLQAAADLHGNCVQNIDYHGEVSTAPARVGARHRR